MLYHSPAVWFRIFRTAKQKIPFLGRSLLRNHTEGNVKATSPLEQNLPRFHSEQKRQKNREESFIWSFSGDELSRF